MWKTLKILINNRNTTADFQNGIQFEIEAQINTVKYDINIAEQFNIYYIDSIKDIIETINIGTEWVNNNIILTNFSEFRKIDLNELGKIVNNIDGTCSVYDTLNGKFLKETFKVIGHILLHFINTSLQTGIFPDDLKTSILTPIQKNLNISINTDTIEFVTEFKYLGFMLDNCLSFNAHFNYIYKKISKKIYFFSRIAFNISPFSAITVYNTIILPHFDYCASILFAFTSNKILALQKLQNRCMRIILKCNRYTNITLMLDTLQWMCITFNFEIHNYPTRNSNNLHIPRTNLSNTSKLFVV
ncbi:hypothetical protein NQ317_005901 [Molorchus minor]|uniref:Uncharacterized protein n=1 Tax=Molorchus minor TaxID=1323400 RepID=A0ABQ9IZ04_9CUCU|nr:hypothetical protein NQ317_005901 [Molorchus minor]